MAVVEDDLAGSPSGQWTEQGTYEVRRQVKIPWSQIDEYAALLAPVSFVLGSQIIHVPPAAFPNNDSLRVAHFSWRPLANEQDSTATVGLNGLIAYQYAVFDITYRPRAYDTTGVGGGDDPIPFLTHSISSAGQFLTFPSAGWKYQNPQASPTATLLNTISLPDDAPMGHFVSESSHEIQIPRCPAPNWSALENYKGQCNLESMTFRGGTYGPEQLLYIGYTARKEYLTTAASAWTIGIQLQSKIVPSADGMGPGYSASNLWGGHNHVYSPYTKTTAGIVKAGWYRALNTAVDTPDVFNDNEVNSIYRLFDMNLLFQAGS